MAQQPRHVNVSRRGAACLLSSTGDDVLTRWRNLAIPAPPIPPKIHIYPNPDVKLKFGFVGYGFYFGQFSHRIVGNNFGLNEGIPHGTLTRVAKLLVLSNQCYNFLFRIHGLTTHFTKCKQRTKWMRENPSSKLSKNIASPLLTSQSLLASVRDSDQWQHRSLYALYQK